jgi:hypothetical protein
MYKVQFRKAWVHTPEQSVQQQQEVKTKVTRDGKTVRRCKFCDLEILFVKDSQDKLLIADARHFFSPLYEGEEYVRHVCAY